MHEVGEGGVPNGLPRGLRGRYETKDRDCEGARPLGSVRDVWNGVVALTIWRQQRAEAKREFHDADVHADRYASSVHVGRVALEVRKLWPCPQTHVMGGTQRLAAQQVAPERMALQQAQTRRRACPWSCRRERERTHDRAPDTTVAFTWPARDPRGSKRQQSRMHARTCNDSSTCRLSRETEGMKKREDGAWRQSHWLTRSDGAASGFLAARHGAKCSRGGEEGLARQSICARCALRPSPWVASISPGSESNR